MNFMEKSGKRTWLVADCYYDSKYNGQVSHEAVCVLNTSDKDANINITLFFEDKDPIYNFKAECKSKRTHHLSLIHI